jgi:hypothetical protein
MAGATGLVGGSANLGSPRSSYNPNNGSRYGNINGTSQGGQPPRPAKFGETGGYGYNPNAAPSKPYKMGTWVGGNSNSANGNAKSAAPVKKSIVAKQPVNNTPGVAKQPVNNTKPVNNNTPGVAKQPVNNTKPSNGNTPKPVDTVKIKPVNNSRPANTVKPVNAVKPVDTAINTPIPITTAPVIPTAPSILGQVNSTGNGIPVPPSSSSEPPDTTK